MSVPHQILCINRPPFIDLNMSASGGLARDSAASTRFTLCRRPRQNRVPVPGRPNNQSMPPLFNFIEIYFFSFLIILIRITSFFVTAPIFSGTTVPAVGKSVFPD